MSRFTFDSTQSLHAWLIGLSSTVSVYVLFEHASNENNKRIVMMKMTVRHASLHGADQYRTSYASLFTDSMEEKTIFWGF